MFTDVYEKANKPRCSSVTHTVNLNFKTRYHFLLFQDNKQNGQHAAIPQTMVSPKPAIPLLRKLFAQSLRLEKVTFNKAFNHL